MRIAFGVAMGIAAIASAPALADGGAARWGDVPLRSSTVNLISTGPESATRISDNFRIRLDSGLVTSPAKSDGGQASRLRKRFSSSMIDYYPMGDGFHVSLGGRLDNRTKGQRNGALANGLLYAPKATRGRNGSSGFKRFSPAMTAGFGETIGKNMTIGLEGGALIARGDPAMREFVRFAHIGSRNDSRFNMGGGSRINPVAQVAFALKF